MKFDSHEIYFTSEKQISYLRKRIWFLARNLMTKLLKIFTPTNPIQFKIKSKWVILTIQRL